MGTIVLYPSPGMGHLIPMVELGKLILNHHHSFSITIFTIIPPFNTGSTASYVQHVSATNPSISFHSLPYISLPNDSSFYPSVEAMNFELIHLSNPNVHQALESISQSSTVAAFIIDLFCTTALSIAASLSIPAYYFYTSGAGELSQTLYFPVIHHTTTKSLKDMNTLLHFPGLPPIPSSDMPEGVLDSFSCEYPGFLELSICLPRSAGIIINTFDSLEPKSVKALSDGLCVPDGPTPPVYCIGPLIAEKWPEGGTCGGQDECLKWLDSQPNQSVVFLCFGSMGLFSAEQLLEIAIGLERSEQRFLWVVRSPPSNKGGHFLTSSDPDLDSLLPDGFLDRTEGRGFVVKTWAPQVAVLNHDAVGGFVTHCGWNSVLEAISAGVPMVAWPLYAEQRFNRVLMVEDMKLALPMNESTNGQVTAEEVSKQVRRLMVSEEGKLIREVTKAKREEARRALSDSGSSRLALAKLVNSLNPGHSKL